MKLAYSPNQNHPKGNRSKSRLFEPEVPMIRLTFLLFTALAATGCASQVPLAKNHPISTQKKAKAIHHWDLLADDVTSQTLKALRKHDINEETPLFVAQPTEQTPFAQTFRNLLITRLVARGLPVSDSNAAAIELQYETQLVTHNSSRYAHPPGSLTLLSAGIWVIRDMITGSTPVMPTALAVSAAADYGAGLYAGGATPTELLITSSIIVNSKYLMRKSDIYYIEDADTSLFKEKSGTRLELRDLDLRCDKESCTPQKR